MFLKQNTAATFRIGPFQSATDGAVVTNLSLAASDVRLSKAGGAFVSKNEATNPTHDENGWYTCTLDDTDANTLGDLLVSVNKAGAMVAWHRFVVLPANVYDSLVAGSDKLQVDVAEWLNAAASKGAASGLPAVDAQAVSDSAAAADAVEANIGNLDAAVSGVGGQAGPGARETTHTIYAADGATPIEGAAVWVSTDAEGSDVIAGTLHTDANGRVTFWLDDGTYYRWVQKGGQTFENPTPFTVSA